MPSRRPGHVEECRGVSVNDSALRERLAIAEAGALDFDMSWTCGF
ncbi:MAG: hypothetical protein ABI593_09395 [Betaproteobacteria bacterium]